MVIISFSYCKKHTQKTTKTKRRNIEQLSQRNTYSNPTTKFNYKNDFFCTKNVPIRYIRETPFRAYNTYQFNWKAILCEKTQTRPIVFKWRQSLCSIKVYSRTKNFSSWALSPHVCVWWMGFCVSYLLFECRQNLPPTRISVIWHCRNKVDSIIICIPHILGPRRGDMCNVCEANKMCRTFKFVWNA